LRSTHCAPDGWKPLAHEKPHTPELQVAEPLGGVLHGMQLEPHEPTASLLTHRCPQACWPAGQLQVPALQAAPAGQSVGSRQPAMHFFVTGSHE
jgi:hypothetical protein